jgi:hypothetical protein
VAEWLCRREISAIAGQCRTVPTQTLSVRIKRLFRSGPYRPDSGALILAGKENHST